MIILIFLLEFGPAQILILLTIIFVFFIFSGNNNKRIRENNLTGRISDKIDKSSDFIGLNFKKAKNVIENQISKSYLIGCNWVLLNENKDYVLYTFLNNDDLLITTNGNVKRAKYELLIDTNSVIITFNDNALHYYLENFKNDFLLLNKVSTDELLYFANHMKYNDQYRELLYREFQNLNDDSDFSKYLKN